ncbi:MAG: N-acetyltransferase family protein [Bacteroidia bacterium]
MGINIKKAGTDHLHDIQHIAEKTWPVAYAEILSPEQMRFMLDKMYAIEALEKQMTAGHFFLLAASGNENIGFASYELNYENTKSTKLHKLYVLPQMQGKNAGKALLNEVINSAKAADQKSLLLNVNRNNKAVDFYKKLDFSIIKEKDIDIGNGYFMNDFVMELKL